MYALYTPSEDGNPLYLLTPKSLAELLEDPRDHSGVTKFEDEEFLKSNSDPNYWPEGVGVLLELKVVQPRPAKWTI